MRFWIRRRNSSRRLVACASTDLALTIAQIGVLSACRARVAAKSAVVPHAASDNGPPWIAAFLDRVSRFTLVVSPVSSSGVMSKALIAAVLRLSFAQCLGTGRNYARWAASNSGFAMSKQQGPPRPGPGRSATPLMRPMRAGPGARITVPGPLDPGLLRRDALRRCAPIPVRIAVGAAAAQRVLDAVGHPADDLGDIAAGLGDRIAHGRPAGRAGGRRG